jgi:hypothetical protein
VIGAARVGFSDAKLGLDTSREVLFAAPILDGPVPVDWERATPVTAPVSDLRKEPESALAFEEVPAAAQQPRNYAEWQKAFSAWLSRTQRLELLRHNGTKLTSNAGEDERAFRTRVQELLREQRDADVEAARKKLATKRESLVSKVSRAQEAVQREQQQASQQKTQTMLSGVAAAVGALLGRKMISTGTLGRATTAARGVGRSMKEAEDVKRAEERLAEEQQKLEAFDEQVRQELQGIAARYDAAVEIERIALAPKRGQVHVLFVALGWDPGVRPES